ncbi:hypothetical protein HDV02_003342 [Globomyces sp. JEL0801]|nr:hypothetical protein HDV02_003342 [Globomyces sp. JEL0801]
MKTTNALLLDKPAGLESHQFSRDEHRFNCIYTPPLDSTILPRQPRVGRNLRNHSDNVFAFGNSQGYEKEKARWVKMSDDYEKNLKLLDLKSSKTKMGTSSVSYNPITLKYLNNENGKMLKEEDAKAKHRLAIRAARLYTKNNTFDPTLCVDLPKFEPIGLTKEDKTAGISSQTKKSGRRGALISQTDKHSTVAKAITDEIEKTAKILETFGPDTEEAKKIEEYLALEKKKFQIESAEPRLLLLGSSDSGKSTFLKQLKILHGKGFTPEELQTGKENALYNVLDAIEKALESSSPEWISQFQQILQFKEQNSSCTYFPDDIIQMIVKFYQNEELQKKVQDLPNIPQTTTQYELII